MSSLISFFVQYPSVAWTIVAFVVLAVGVTVFALLRNRGGQIIAAGTKKATPVAVPNQRRARDKSAV